MTTSLTSLDQKRNNRNSFCGRYTLNGRSGDDPPDVRTYKRLNCKCWRCRTCAKKRAGQLQRAIAETAQARGLTRLLTLTLDPNRCTPNESVAHIRRCFNKLRTYLKRQFGRSISYIAVTEFQKSGYAHMHVLVDRFIPQSWIRDAWDRLGGGRIVDIRFVDIDSVSAYLAGYLGKGLLSENFKRGDRRYSSSRDIRLTPKPSTAEPWTKLARSIYAYRDRHADRLVDEHHDREGVLQWFRVTDASATDALLRESQQGPAGSDLSTPDIGRVHPYATEHASDTRYTHRPHTPDT